MKEVKVENLQPGMVVRREWWNIFRTVLGVNKEKNFVEFTDGYRAALAGNFSVKEPNQVKIGDAVAVPWAAEKYEQYVVHEIDPDGKVRLRNVTTQSIAFGWYDLKESPTWSINGVPVPEFFNEIIEVPQPTPKKPRRIYNAE